MAQNYLKVLKESDKVQAEQFNEENPCVGSWPIWTRRGQTKMKMLYALQTSNVGHPEQSGNPSVVLLETGDWLVWPGSMGGDSWVMSDANFRSRFKPEPKDIEGPPASCVEKDERNSEEVEHE